MEAFDTFEDWWGQYTLPDHYSEGRVMKMLEDAYLAGSIAGYIKCEKYEMQKCKG